MVPTRAVFKNETFLPIIHFTMVLTKSETNRTKGKHRKFYATDLLLRDIYFEFPFMDVKLTEFLNKLKGTLFETISLKICVLFLKKKVHLLFTEFQGLIYFTCINLCKYFRFIVRTPEKMPKWYNRPPHPHIL
jgi:hypothetical protein